MAAFASPCNVRHCSVPSRRNHTRSQVAALEQGSVLIVIAVQHRTRAAFHLLIIIRICKHAGEAAGRVVRPPARPSWRRHGTPSRCGRPAVAASIAVLLVASVQLSSLCDWPPLGSRSSRLGSRSRHCSRSGVGGRACTARVVAEIICGVDIATATAISAIGRQRRRSRRHDRACIVQQMCSLHGALQQTRKLLAANVPNVAARVISAGSSGASTAPKRCSHCRHRGGNVTAAHLLAIGCCQRAGYLIARGSLGQRSVDDERIRLCACAARSRMLACEQQ